MVVGSLRELRNTARRYADPIMSTVITVVDMLLRNGGVPQMDAIRMMYSVVCILENWEALLDDTDLGIRDAFIRLYNWEQSNKGYLRM